MHAPPGLLLSLSDIALLAKVQRPVVSVWRARSRGTESPFPAPAEAGMPQELFAADQITQWLAATGRGNNPYAAEDAAAFAALPGPNARHRHFTALTALLSLRCLSHQALRTLSREELLDLADDVDPEDSFLYAELAALGPDLTPLAVHADLLTEASYTAAAAVAQLFADRFRAHITSLAGTALTREAVDLVALTAVELAAGTLGTPVFLDDGGSDFLPAVAELLGETSEALLAVGTGRGEAARLARRRLLTVARDHANLQTHDRPPQELTGPLVRLAQFPSPAFPESDPATVLTAIDNLTLAMDATAATVVLAPAALLVDAVADGPAGPAVDAIRSDVLRSGRVRAIVHLPQGLLKSKPRQAQALWILGATRRDVPIAERWTMVADLTGLRLSPDVQQDLVGDLAASMGDLDSINAHSFRFATLVRTHTLLASHGSLTAAALQAHVGPRPTVREPTGAEPLLRAEHLLAVAASPLPGLAGVAVEPSEHAPLPATPLSMLLRAGSVKYLPGHRIAAEHIGAAVPGRAQLRLLGPAELHSPTDLPGPPTAPARFIAQLTFAAQYPQGRLTEPGDIIFTTGERPAALVDEEGAAVVQYPARILRINGGDPGGLLPELLAQDLRCGGRGGWRQWPVRRIRDGERAALSAALAAVDEERRRLTIRLQRLDELRGSLLDGTARGSFQLLTLGNTTKGTS